MTDANGWISVEECMKESDYVKATNLAKLSIAQSCILSMINKGMAEDIEVRIRRLMNELETEINFKVE